MKNIAIIFGGKSAEHEVSLDSARNVVDALDKEKYNPVLIGITRKGKWFLKSEIPEKEVGEDGQPLSLVPGAGSDLFQSKEVPPIHAIFPVLHGPFGEDGTIQGLFRMMDVPFVAPGVLGSSAAMDKEVSKKLLEAEGIPVADYLIFHDSPNLKKVERKFDYPIFIKPANLGSSVGVSKVEDRDELKKAIDHAFKFDEKILIEESIDGRELECSVLGNTNPDASKLGEIRPENFYSYEAKYLDDGKAELIVPAEVEDTLEQKMRETAVKAFKALCCKGMARVDFLVADEIYVNELNTIPGFTRISMYPKLWGETGLDYTDLLTKLIELGIQRYEKRKKFKVRKEL